MKKSLLILAVIASSAAGAFAGPGPSYQGIAASRDLPAASRAAAHCPAMLSQTAAGKAPATALNCSLKSVKDSAQCRAHCG